MPTVGPQGSRGGLITAVVVFTVGFVASTIFAIYFGVLWSKQLEEYKHLKDQTKQIYNDTSSPRFQALLNEERTQNPNREQTVLAAAIEDAQILSDALVGKTSYSTTQPTAAVDEMRQAIADANTQLPDAAIPADATLKEAFQAVVTFASNQKAQATKARGDQSAAAADAARQIADAQSLSEQAKKDLAEANRIKQTYLDQANAAQVAYQNKSKEMQASIDQQTAAFNRQLQQEQTAGAAKDQKINDLNLQLSKTLDKLAGKRPEPADLTLSQPDGRIISIASTDVLYISLGSSDHIFPGMTFQVYDQRDGIPKTVDGLSAEDLPVGEGSIEVERVFADSAQCRVIKIQPGQHIKEGDVIANLVYDRNTRYNFVVFGNFDLARKNQPIASDRQKINALVTLWGGKIMNRITPDTDFVVMGFEPTVHAYTADELQDPINASKKANEEAELKAYNDTVDQAKALHIPILNQNRFLLFCGYYENAAR